MNAFVAIPISVIVALAIECLLLKWFWNKIIEMLEKHDLELTKMLLSKLVK